jgi:uncharacterized DUF497 family protein
VTRSDFGAELIRQNRLHHDDGCNVRSCVYARPVATVVHGDFEWDDAKAESNLAKHGVAFEEAVLAMKDPLSLDFDDLVEPANLITLAATPEGRILYIVSTERDDRLRIISARDATPSERRRYEEAD